MGSKRDDQWGNLQTSAISVHDCMAPTEATSQPLWTLAAGVSTFGRMTKPLAVLPLRNATRPQRRCVIQRFVSMPTKNVRLRLLSPPYNRLPNTLHPHVGACAAGVSNSFLISTRSKEALLYNDASVNENGHAATAFRLLLQPSCNFAKDFELDEFRFFRRLVIAISESSLPLQPRPPARGGTMTSSFALVQTRLARWRNPTASSDSRTFSTLKGGFAATAAATAAAACHSR